MFRHLKLENIILIEKADLSLNAGLNILTGETGSGKSAIMHGLMLAIGARGDTSLIRRGCDKGIVEAVIEPNCPALCSLLDEGGIEHEPGQELIIRRELTASGKGRIFINHQAVQLTFLRKLGEQIVQIVGQHSNQRLLSVDYHMQVLDLFGNHQLLLESYQASFDKESALRQTLDALIQQETQRIREIDICLAELEELEEAQLRDGEEEELFAEYTLLFHAEELSSKIADINHSLSGERQPILPQLNRHKQALESLLQFDPSLQEHVDALQNVCLELQEVSHSLRLYQGTLQDDPGRLQEVNDRLSLLNKLKRKYGASVEAILTYQSACKAKLKRLENAEEEIERLQHQLQMAEIETNECAEKLTAARKKTKEGLENALSGQLHALNMAKAQFIVQLTPQKRTRKGDDKVEFFLQPNIGEHQIPLKDGASGGEISRVLLALQTLLAGKEQISTLVFDEVDANIGGETATIVGDKLKEISRQHQVICITHFPQVANQADHHLQISKMERDGRTLTLVEALDASSKQRELARMAGFK